MAGHDGYQRLARVTRYNAQGRGFSGGVGRFVQRHFQCVRCRGCISRRIPASIKIARSGNVIPTNTFNHNFVFTPIDSGLDVDGAAIQICFATGHAFAGVYFFPVPVSVLPVPLIAGLDAVHCPADLHRHLGFVLINCYDLETCGCTFGNHIFKQRFYANHWPAGGKPFCNATFNRTAGSFGNTHGEFRFERLTGIVNFGEIHRNADTTIFISAQIVRQRILLRVKPVIMTPETVTGIGIQTVCSPHNNLAFNRQIGTGCAKQITCVGG